MRLECGLFKEVQGFTCTGSDESHIWKKLHGDLLNDFHCGTCQRHADNIFKGVHSMVSLGIGKKLVKEEYKDNFMALYYDVINVYMQAVRDGRLNG